MGGAQELVSSPLRRLTWTKSFAVITGQLQGISKTHNGLHQLPIAASACAGVLIFEPRRRTWLPFASKAGQESHDTLLDLRPSLVSRLLDG